MGSANLLLAVALTNKLTNQEADELSHFKEFLKHNENITFADDKYLINKAKQEKLHMPSNIPEH